MQNNLIIKLINLQDIKVNNIHYLDNTKHIEIEMSSKRPTCPICNNHVHIHDYRKQVIKDIPMSGEKVLLILKKRRFKCSCCGKQFYESINFVGKYQRMTKRLIMYILKKSQEQRSIKNISNELFLSSTPINRVINSVYRGVSKLPEVICIDEFKGNSSGHKYHLSIVDGHDRKILDILKSRSKEDVTSYFKKFSPEERKSVKYLVTDMYLPYKNLIEQFPNAIHIIDKYHYIRQVTWAFENVRKKIQNTMQPSLRKYYKRSKSLLSKPNFKLSISQREQVEIMLWYSAELREAYSLKESYYNNFLVSKTREEAKIKLSEWIYLAEQSNIKEFKESIKSHTNWSTGILNSFTVPYTNGVIEGFNNKIKVLKRISYGFRNFENFRKRILLLA